MTSPNDELSVPSTGDLTFGPDTTVFSVRLPMDADNPANAKTRFRLHCKEPVYDVTLTMQDDQIPNNEFIELLFTGVWTRGKYTLEVDPKNGKPKYTVFKDRKINELPPPVPGARTAEAGWGEEEADAPAQREPSPENQRFLVFFGSPATYRGFDPKHDKNWKSYLLPIEINGKTCNLPKKPTEIYWYFFEPGYAARWKDDDAIGVAALLSDATSKGASLFSDKNQSDLARLRNDEIEKHKKNGHRSFLDVAREIATDLEKKCGYSIRVGSFTSPKDLFVKIGEHPDASIEKIWYFGHGIEKGLVLRLSPNRNDDNPYIIDGGEIISTDEISAHSHLRKKFSVHPGRSVFFACNSLLFAKTWHDVFSVPSEGGIGTMLFNVSMEKGTTPENVLDKLKGNLEWQSF